MREKTNEKFMVANNYGLVLTLCIYVGVAIISIAMFGQDIQSVVLTDIGELKKPDGKAFWESYVT
jgi:amino acid permease